jgi:uncharacterized LabA/DUF88 family protein
MIKPKSTDVDRLAVLIDAENMSPKVIERLLTEVAKYGNANVKRAYGDWTTDNLGGWKEKLNRFAIQPMQQFRYTRGKNSSDSALIIDAMDLLYSGVFDGFCLVSSDSDFTRLACRIRESGLTVYGFGDRQTAEPFVKACDRFVFVENLDGLAPPSKAGASPSSPDEPLLVPNPDAVGQTQVSTTTESDKARIAVPSFASIKAHIKAEIPRQLIEAAYEAASPERNWISPSLLAEKILRLSPSFDTRAYGFRNLTELIKASGLFDTQMRASKKNKAVTNLLVKLTDEPAQPVVSATITTVETAAIDADQPAPAPAAPAEPAVEK